MPGLSAVVITYNEEKNISRCIDSLSTIADEIIVVDSFSQDATKKICLDKKIKFIENAFIGYVQQKNFALAQTQFDYVISLDADEYLSTELTESIRQIKNSWKYEAYEMSRLSSYGGRWINHGNWYPDRKIRLWNKNFGSWGGGNPHEKVILKKNVNISRLKGNILHEAYYDSYETLRKIQSYSDIYARENAHQKSSSVLKIIFRASFTFFKSYIIKRGFLDGFEGLMVAMAESNHTFYKYAKLYEANKQSQNKKA